MDNITSNSSKNKEYEIISHNAANFKLFIVELLYRNPHAHKDFEVGLIINGSLDLITLSGTHKLSTGDLFIMNPYQSHELKGEEPALIMSLQVPAAFFETYYPDISHVTFLPEIINQKPAATDLAKLMMDLAKEYYIKKPLFQFRCAILINHLFYYLLQKIEYSVQTEQEAKANRMKGKRARRIMHYVNDHYTEKILLSDLAAEEGLDLYYLSHFFKDTFGVSFQTYVNKLRCEHARHLLLVTNHPLLDICMESGFSDPKYFNKSFKEQYGCLPKQYRINFASLELKEQQYNMLSTQKFLSDEASIVILGI